jgi:hypothetical protein
VPDQRRTADFPVFEGTGEDDRTFWWRYPTGTMAVTDDTEQKRILLVPSATATSRGLQIGAMLLAWATNARVGERV